ncbi:heme-binding protein [Sulfitobacter sp. AS92]|uniref:GlcG/HbpS family heme-binding protein n=1 Tax=Sulfitobacter sp. AS92 TaxID=3135783 RepID=UPI00317E93E7
MRLQTSLPLEKANTIVTKALALGRKASLLPLTVVVLDAGGKLVAMQSEDGSGLVRFEIAFGKAYGALGMGISSRVIRDRLSERPAFQNAIAVASGGQFIPVPGGVLIEDGDGSTLGAVGISGDTSDKDEYCAIEAIQSAGFKSEPAVPDPDWRSSSLSDHYPAST